MSQIVIGVMGPGQATAVEKAAAYKLGQAIAEQGWVLLTGGRAVGVMDAACHGAKAGGGLTVGILPGDTRSGISTAVDIPICTGLGNARNALNVLSSQVIVACGMGPGTASEVALALKAGRPVILLQSPPEAQLFFCHLSGTISVSVCETVEAAIQQIQKTLENS